MKTNSTQQEILLMTGTTFSSKCWEKNEPDKRENLTEKEQLEEACWNGMLYEMLPEICSQEEGDEKMYLWQIKEGASFIELELGAFPEEKEVHFSIDPYSFMAVQSLS